MHVVMMAADADYSNMIFGRCQSGDHWHRFKIVPGSSPTSRPEEIQGLELQRTALNQPWMTS